MRVRGVGMAVASGVSQIEDDVRELVRRRGLDPLTDPAAVSRLVAEVIADYDERSLSGGVPLLSDPGGAARRVTDAVAGFWPLQRLSRRPDRGRGLDQRATDMRVESHQVPRTHVVPAGLPS